MRCAVVLFPGSNCDRETLAAFASLPGVEAYTVWHQSQDLLGADLVVLPGGFSFGDYLRAGAIARFSPVMTAVRRHAEAGGLVLGICNGFQILVEAGLLPGALAPNRDLRFHCQPVHLRVERADLPFTRAFAPGEVISLPIAHGEGRYVAPPEGLAALEARGQVVFRYARSDGAVVPEANPNGSEGSVAGLVNPEGNVLGMMPHPERYTDPLLGGIDGRRMLDGLVREIRGRLSAEGVGR